MENKVDRLLQEASFNYSRSKEDVWSSMQKQMENTSVEETRVIPLNSQWWKIGIAASISLLLMAGLSSFLYTVDVQAAAGETNEIQLPDGSRVNLNSESILSYKPLFWYFDRSADLEGEAFFEVEKGNRFTIYSNQGQTSVLGTSFNIYAREDKYQVYCETGKVSVATADEEVVLVPGEMATATEGESLLIDQNTRKEYVLAWTLNKFIYNTTALTKVIQDIKRHYDVDIQLNINDLNSYHYTGIFDRSIDARSALEIVCHSFDFSLISTTDRSFVIEDK